MREPAAAFQNHPPMWLSTASLIRRSLPTREISTGIGTLPLRKPGIFRLPARSEAAWSIACLTSPLGTSTVMRTRLSGSSSTVAFTGRPLCQHSPGLPHARGTWFLEQPDEEQDEDDQQKDSTADIHRPLLSRRFRIESSSYPPALSLNRAGVAELVDATGLGPVGPEGPWRFKSSRPHPCRHRHATENLRRARQRVARAYAAANPSRQLGWRSVHPSLRFAFSFEAPRIWVIRTTPGSPAARRASQRGTRRGGVAPIVSASTGSHSRTGAGSSSTTL